MDRSICSVTAARVGNQFCFAVCSKTNPPKNNVKKKSDSLLAHILHNGQLECSYIFKTFPFTISQFVGAVFCTLSASRQTMKPPHSELALHSTLLIRSMCGALRSSHSARTWVSWIESTNRSVSESDSWLGSCWCCTLTLQAEAPTLKII